MSRAPMAADDRDLEAVEDPDRAEADDHEPVKARPGQPVQPRRDRGLDDGGVGVVGHGPVLPPVRAQQTRRFRCLRRNAPRVVDGGGLACHPAARPARLRAQGLPLRESADPDPTAGGRHRSVGGHPYD